MKEQIISFIENIKSNTNINSFDEASTKQAIVLKLLFLLGWDTFNVEEVAPEYSVQTTRVDYSLRVNNSNKAFVEVKKPIEDLDKHQEQLLNYSFKEGIALSILTNGITWWFYLPLKEGSWEQRRFYSIDLLQQHPEDIALKFFDFLHKDNIISGQSIRNAEKVYKGQQKKNIIKEALPKAWEKLITDPDDILVDLLSETTEKLCGYFADVNMVHDFLLKNKNNFLVIEEPSLKIKKTKNKLQSGKKIKAKLSENYTGKSISSFVFKGKKHNVTNWISLLLTLCDILISENKNDFKKVVELVGRKRPYFTYNPEELRQPKKIEKSNIYMETNLSSNQIVKISLKMLTLLGYSNKQFKIESY